MPRIEFQTIRAVTLRTRLAVLMLATAPASLIAQYPIPVAPVAWWNDATDITLGVWARSGPTPLGTISGMISRGFGGFQSATIKETVDFHLHIQDPAFVTSRGLSGSVGGWAMDGTAGANLRLSRPVRTRDRDVETGFRLMWVATQETAYLDPLLWDNAGSGEATLFHTRSIRSANATIRFQVEGSGGILYERQPPGASGSAYVGRGFARGGAEVSLRRRLSLFVLGARGYAGGFYADQAPSRQLAIPIQGADPYQTLENPWIRSEGAPLADRNFFYHAPGHANLRGYRPGLGGRWAGSLNVELEADLWRRSGGVVRRASLVGFWDGAVVDTLAAPRFDAQAYNFLADAGGGLRIWLAFGSLQFPLRVEFPLFLSQPSFAHDRERTADYVEFRWLVSVQSIF